MLTDADYRPYVLAAIPLYYPDLQPEVELLSLSENATYLVKDKEGTSVFRVHRPLYHDFQAIKSEHQWVELIRNNTSIDTPRPVTNIYGETVSTITVGDETKHVSVYAFIQGVVAEESEHSISYQQLGEITAELHLLAENFTPAEEFQRFSWDIDTMISENARWGDWHDFAGLGEETIALLDQVIEKIHSKITQYGRTRDRFGIIHADLRMSNVMIGEKAQDLTVIDFDDCGWSWYLIDLASVLTFEEERPDADGIIREWLEGYRAVRPLSQEDLDMIPTFMILRRIQFMAWIASHAHSLHAQYYQPEFEKNTVILAQKYLSDPEWLRIELSN